MRVWKSDPDECVSVSASVCERETAHIVQTWGGLARNYAHFVSIPYSLCTYVLQPSGGYIARYTALLLGSVCVRV